MMRFLARLLLFVGVIASAGATTPQGLFVVGGSGVGPHNGSITAAVLTAGKTINGVYTAGNSLCDAVTPFYWEFGTGQGPISGGAVYKGQQTTILQATRVAIASASKMIYHMYVAQKRINASTVINATDISYLHMTAGYTNLGSGDGTGASCPSSLATTYGVRDVSTCLLQTNTNNGQLYDWQNPADVGHFAYSGSQFEVHARDFGGLAGLSGTNAALNTNVVGLVAPGTHMQFSQPLVAGGIYASAADYAIALRGVLNGGALLSYLGTNEVCANPGADYSNQLINGVAGSNNCDATSSPITQENWQYGLGGWLISDPATNGDFAVCSPGSFGFDPCIDSTKTYYFVLSRKGAVNTGYASEKCLRLIRRAVVTEQQQTGSIPN